MESRWLSGSTRLMVLILIIMEDTHGALGTKKASIYKNVLILIIMEDTHGEQKK